MPDLNSLLYDLRRISEHREQLTEKKIQSIHKSLTKELNNFIADQYVEWSDADGRLTVAQLDKARKKAWFLGEIAKRVDNMQPDLRKEIAELIDTTYEKTYKGMYEAFKKADTDDKIKAIAKEVKVNPSTLKQAMNNNISKLTLDPILEKNRSEILYRIQQELNIGLMNGDRYEDMAKRVSKVTGFSESRANNIVRTETHRNVESGFMDGAEGWSDLLIDEGYIYAVTWCTRKDERVRPQYVRRKGKGWKRGINKSGANHMIMEGVTVKVGEEFDLKDGAKAKAPSMSGEARHDCNCRCFLKYDVMTVEEFAKATGQTPEQVRKKYLTKADDGGIIEVQGGKIMNINNIDSPIEQRNTAKGNPNAILQFNRPLNNRQQNLLDNLPEYDSKVTVKKSSVNMKDLSALTAMTGDEFALFTKGKERLIIRGNANSVNIDIEKAVELNKQGYKWSGHTHPGTEKSCLLASNGDVEILKCFNQDVAYIYNSKGEYLDFWKE